MARETIESLLAEPDRGVSRIHDNAGLFSLFFREILHRNKFTEAKFSQSFRRYIQGVRDVDRTGHKALKGNLRKQLAIPDMTYRLFLRALRVLGVSSINIQLKVSFTDGSQSTHQRDVDIGQSQD